MLSNFAGGGNLLNRVDPGSTNALQNYLQSKKRVHKCEFRRMNTAFEERLSRALLSSGEAAGPLAIAHVKSHLQKRYDKVGSLIPVSPPVSSTKMESSVDEQL